MVRQLLATIRSIRHQEQAPFDRCRIGPAEFLPPVALVFAQFFHVGCTNDANSDHSRSTPIVTIGRALDAPRNQIFADVVDGRITPDGQHLVILDAAPPYVRVFDRSGTVVSVAVEKGEGPLEMTDPHSVAVTNSSLALVDLGSIKEFSFDGTLNQAFSDLNFLPQTISRGCNDDWLVYGPGRNPGGTFSWLRAIDPSDDGRDMRTVLVDKNRGSGVVVRRSRPITASDGKVLLYHDAASPPTTILYECPDYGVVSRYSSGEESSEGPEVSTASEYEAVRPPADATPLSSVFFWRDAPLITVMRWESGAGSFEIRSPEADRIGSVSPPSRVLDVRDSLVLLALDDPMPHVILTKASSVLALRDGEN